MDKQKNEATTEKEHKLERKRIIKRKFKVNEVSSDAKDCQDSIEKADLSCLDKRKKKISRIKVKSNPMIVSELKDTDGFSYQFEENTSNEDKSFFIKNYPKVDVITNSIIRCRTCDEKVDIHLVNAPESEKTILTHPVLRITHCNKCSEFYNTREFKTSENGSECYCKWCGKGGGEAFCCKVCPCIFCNKCIKANFTSTYLKHVKDVNGWKCFVCDKNSLITLRAQHWALLNFIEKRSLKTKTIDGNVLIDRSTILVTPNLSSIPTIRRPSGKVKIISKQTQVKNDDEIVSKPTEPVLDSTVSKLAPKRMRIATLVKRSEVITQLEKQSPMKTYVNKRREQERGRPKTAQIPGLSINQIGKTTIFPTIRLSPGHRFPINGLSGPRPLMPRITIQSNSLISLPGTQVRPQVPRIMLTQQRTLRIVKVIPKSSKFTLFNGGITVERALIPDTPIGKAKIEFEDNIISGMKVCQHTINKMIKLSNSSSFKTSNSFQDIKGLYMHLQYLFTYTMGKYKAIQDSLTEGMESLDVLDPRLLHDDEEDTKMLEENKAA
ncbi:unnamed protein product [Diamesa serratosioi]